MIHAVILAGGWGRRFWPRSRRRQPKQLLCIGSRYSLIQNLFNIIISAIPKERIWVVTNKKYAHNLKAHLPSLSKHNILIEPQARNTAAAIGLASLRISQLDPQAVTLILSSDHMLGQKKRFLKTLRCACRLARKEDALITIGIIPHRPAHEFGYVKIARNLTPKAKNIYKVESFVEKPSLKKAKAYLRSKKYLWNSGIFVWKAASILEAIRKYLPRLYYGLEKIEEAKGLPQYNRRLAKEYRRFKDVSIDYGVMEKAQNIYTVVGDFPWADIGSWNNITHDFFAPDTEGNIIQGLHRGIDTSNSIILGENKHLIATLGLRDLVIVHTPTATLVCKKDRAQEVKKLTNILEKDKHCKKFL